MHATRDRGSRQPDRNDLSAARTSSGQNCSTVPILPCVMDWECMQATGSASPACLKWDGRRPRRPVSRRQPRAAPPCACPQSILHIACQSTKDTCTAPACDGFGPAPARCRPAAAPRPRLPHATYCAAAGQPHAIGCCPTGAAAWPCCWAWRPREALKVFMARLRRAIRTADVILSASWAWNCKRQAGGWRDGA